MISRIDQAFSHLRERHEAALIAYVMAGDPSLADTEQLVLALQGAGADIIVLDGLRGATAAAVGAIGVLLIRGGRGRHHRVGCTVFRSHC